jgi:hypothetical protein
MAKWFEIARHYHVTKITVAYWPLIGLVDKVTCCAHFRKADQDVAISRG